MAKRVDVAKRGVFDRPKQAVRALRRRVSSTWLRSTPLAPDPAQLATPANAKALTLDLGGKVALVTGAGGELGRSIARTLGLCGASVAVHYFRGGARAEQIARELAGLGVRACCVGADVTSADSVLAMRHDIERWLGPVDILVSNAASWYPKLSVIDQGLEAFDGVYRTSVLQVVIAAKVFVPSMIERRWGRVIGISTEVAMQALPHESAYTAGKRGMDGVLRTLAREVGPHQITVNQVAPGWVISDRDRSAGTERNLGYEYSVALRRRGYDQDAANAVAFLASDLAAFITGVYLPVCGGTVMPAI